MKALDEAQLAVQLENLDRAFDERGFPPVLRPSEAFDQIYGSIHDHLGRHDLFVPIQQWFLNKYGELVVWDGTLGLAPMIIRGRLHFSTINFVEQDVLVDSLEVIETLNKEEKAMISREEWKSIAEKQTLANVAYNQLYQLRCDKSWLTKEELAFANRGFFDVDGISPALKRSDTQTAIFLCHQAAEKFLKAAYLRSGGDNPKGVKSFLMLALHSTAGFRPCARP